MHWDLGLPLLVVLVTFILFFAIYWSARKLMFDPRREEGLDADTGSQTGSH